MTSDGFVFWAEPEDIEIEEGLSVVVGGGDSHGGERAFVCIQTEHANARALLTLEQLDYLIGSLNGIRAALAMTTDGAPC